MRIRLVVDKVWPGVQGRGGAIVSGIASGVRHRARLSFDLIDAPPRVGDVLEITGQQKDHPQHGPQVEATEVGLAIPDAAEIVAVLAMHPAAEGIGPKTAGKLYNALGARLSDVLDAGNTNALCEVISPERAAHVVRAWTSIRGEYAARMFLAKFDLPTRLKRQAGLFWGVDIEAALSSQPYRLLAFASAAPQAFKAVDAFARSFGVAVDDPRRLDAAIEHSIYAALDQQHTGLSISTLRSSLQARISNQASAAMERIESSDRFSITGDLVQTNGLAMLEDFVRRRLCTPGDSPQSNLFDVTFNVDVLDEFEHRQKFKLTEEQRSAVEVVLSNRVCAIVGGAGVGKTTVLKAVYHCLSAANLGIRQMALAGRAARRMSEATGMEAFTIAGAINRAKEGGSSFFEGDPVVVIDEASMVDLLQMSRLLQQIPASSRIVLVGDPMQLPPIGAGLVFHRIVEKDAVPVARLTKIQRASGASGIPVASKTVRSGAWPDFPRFNKGMTHGISVLSARDSQIHDAVLQVAVELDAASPDSQILTALKSGKQSSKENLNALLAEQYQSAKRLHNGWHFRVGDKVMFTRNDHEREVFNGSLGFIVDAQDGGLTVDFDTGTIYLSESDIEHLEWAWAITVHKSQGSEFRRVIVPLTRSRLLDRSLIYTAITRAKEQVVIIGDEAAIREAVAKPASAFSRSVGFLSELQCRRVEA